MKSNVCEMILIFLLLFFTSGTSIAAGKGHSLVNCAIQDGPCVQEVNGGKVTFDVLPRPVKAMQDLLFKVTIDGNVTLNNSPYIDLNMPAMDMGRNRVALELKEKNTYEGQGVIVRCKSGHRIWRATVNLPGTGRVEYIFNVVY